MNVDELELVSQLRDAPPLRREAYERARATLRTVMAESGPAGVPETVSVPGPAAPRRAPARRDGFSWARTRRGTLGKLGLGAGIAVAAAAVAIVVVATSTPRSQEAGPAEPGTAVSHSAGPTGSAAAAPAVNSTLVTLAARITASNGSGSGQGNATLVIRSQTVGSAAPSVIYELYADSGTMYATETESALSAAVARNIDISAGSVAPEVAVARTAATGDVTAARIRMVNLTPNYLGLGLSPAAQQAEWAKGYAAEQAQESTIYKEKGIKVPPKPYTAKSVQEEADNYLWNYAVLALIGDGADPQVRVGVLRLIATISGVTVANSTTDGQPTLTLTAGPEVFGGHGSQVLTISATTGTPIRSVIDAGTGVPDSVETYQVSRVTLADIEAGQF